MNKKFLLFGHMADCEDFVRKNLLNIEQWVHVSDVRCFLGRRNIKMIWCGPYNFHYDKLWREAQKYFKSIGEKI